MLKINKLLKKAIGIVLFLMLITNVYLYTKSIVIGDQIVQIETKIKQLKLENGEYEKRIYSFNSLQNLKAVSENLGFIQQAKPIYLDSFHYALAPQNE